MDKIRFKDGVHEENAFSSRFCWGGWLAPVSFLAHFSPALQTWLCRDWDEVAKIMVAFAPEMVVCLRVFPASPRFRVHPDADPSIPAICKRPTSQLNRKS